MLNENINKQGKPVSKQLMFITVSGQPQFVHIYVSSHNYVGEEPDL